jgi:hypothetical protein
MVGQGVRRAGGCERGRYGGREQGTSLSGPWRRSKRVMEEGKRSDRGWLGELQVNRWGRLNHFQPERAPLGQ